MTGFKIPGFLSAIIGSEKDSALERFVSAVENGRNEEVREAVLSLHGGAVESLIGMDGYLDERKVRPEKFSIVLSHEIGKALKEILSGLESELASGMHADSAFAKKFGSPEKASEMVAKIRRLVRH